MRVRYAIAIAVTAALVAPAALTAQTPAKAPAQTPPPAAAPPAVLKRSAPPARGTVEVGYTQSAKLEGNTVVTTFKIQNMAAGSIVGLTITEFWYDKAGQPLQGTGDRQRLRTPLQPGEVATIVLKSPKVPGMTNNVQYKFEHNYGILRPKLVKTIK